MFKQRRKDQKRLASCSHPKHVFRKNKGKCLCGDYYKDNGRLLRNKGDQYVAGTIADFRYTPEKFSKKSIKRRIKALVKAKRSEIKRMAKR